MAQYPKSDPRYHTDNIRHMLQDLRQQLRDDIDAVSEPKAQALFETAAEVLGGLETAFRHYEQGEEKAWRQ